MSLSRLPTLVLSLFPLIQFYSILFDLVTRCLEVDPKNRISAKQALEHDFFRHAPPGHSFASYICAS